MKHLSRITCSLVTIMVALCVNHLSWAAGISQESVEGIRSGLSGGQQVLTVNESSGSSSALILFEANGDYRCDN